MRTPLNMARLRTTRRTAFCCELSTCAVRTSSAVRPNFVRVPVAVTSATASPRQRGRHGEQSRDRLCGVGKDVSAVAAFDARPIRGADHGAETDRKSVVYRYSARGG